MRSIATHLRWALLACLVVAALLAVFPASAGAQINPLWDHYKVYFVNPPIPYPVPGPPVTLMDQFTTSTHLVEVLDRFMNPTEKTVFDPPPARTYPINDPILHYAWWRISPQPFTALVTATDQFGDHTLNVFDARYLLNPALKNVHGEPPLRNHYKCYDCQGQPVNVNVMMNDQFGSWQATVTFPRFFCNPVEKRIAVPGTEEQIYPILDTKQHYICYEYQTEDPNHHPAIITDQFVTDRTVDLGPSRLICVPTDKTGITSTGSSTWGRIKVLYR